MKPASKRNGGSEGRGSLDSENEAGCFP